MRAKIILTCQSCANGFMSLYKTQLYCSNNCRKEAKRKRDEDWKEMLESGRGVNLSKKIDKG